MLRKASIVSCVVLFFLIVFPIVSCHPELDPNGVYVALNGNDSNPGTLEKPWATINHAAEVAKAGETVYIRGGTYRLNQQIRAKNSGTKTAWIVYSSYPGEQAILDARDIQIGPPVGNPPFPHDQGAFQVEKVSYIRIKNLELDNSHSAGFTVRDSHHIELYNNTTKTTYSSGIAVWCNLKSGRTCEHNRVLGNTIVNANTFEMLMPGFERPREAPHEALSVGDIQYFEIAYNHLYDCVKEGIDVKGSSRHGAIHHNYVHNLERQGIYIDNWGDLLEDIEIYDNIVHDSKGAGMAISVEGGKLATNIRIHHNLFYNNLGTGILFGRWGGDGFRKNIKIYNNTLYHNGYGNPESGNTYYWITGGLYLFSSNLQDVDIKNNIFSDNQGFQIGYSDRYLKNNQTIDSVFQEKKINIEYNLFFDKNKIRYPIYVGWQPDGYANVYQAKGQHVIEKAPSFINSESGNFYLNRNSPAIDRGSAEKTYLDPDGTRNDIGAFYSGEKQRFWWKTNFPPRFDVKTSKK
ncbi:MAG TPA: right-handed parallel beta-helix repeat-containing protein [Allocoleopsis sp.]